MSHISRGARPRDSEPRHPRLAPASLDPAVSHWPHSPRPVRRPWPFTGCGPVEPLVIVNETVTEAEDIRLAEDRIRTMVGTPFTDPANWGWPVQVFDPARGLGCCSCRARRNCVGGWSVIAYSMRPVELLFDYNARVWAEALSGGSPAVGTHGGDAGFIMQNLSEALDAFVGDHRRMEAEVLVWVGQGCSHGVVVLGPIALAGLDSVRSHVWPMMFL